MNKIPLCLVTLMMTAYFSVGCVNTVEQEPKKIEREAVVSKPEPVPSRPEPLAPPQEVQSPKDDSLERKLALQKRVEKMLKDSQEAKAKGTQGSDAGAK